MTLTNPAGPRALARCLLAALALTLLAACDPDTTTTQSASTPTATASAQTAVDPTGAIKGLVSGPYHYAISGFLAFDTTGVFGKLTPAPVSGEGIVSTAERVSVTVVIGQNSERTVIVDGVSWVSGDGGVSFQRVTSAQKYPAGSGPALGAGLAQSRTTQGAPTAQGVRFTAPLNATDAAVSGFISSVTTIDGKFAAGRVGKNVTRDTIAPYVTFTSGAVDLEVSTTTGRPVSVSYRIEVRSDLPKMNDALIAAIPGAAAPFPASIQTSVEQVTLTITDFGKVVTVTPPPG